MDSLKKLLELTIEKKASDLHIAAYSPPQIRVDGKLIALEYNSLKPEETKKLSYEILNEKQISQFEKSCELDLSFDLTENWRFRANIFMEKNAVSAAFRPIPFKILKFDELNLPKILIDIIKKPHGLILITGPTGSGKSTTLASLIDDINEARHEHIITIEDPIEFIHKHKNCVINQREIKRDTESFQTALKYVLRQDPDVVLIGEMRDLETIQATITVAETGHLVFATLHTNTAVSTIDRIIDVFPPYQQPQIRTQLSFILEAVVSQRLIPKLTGGRVCALEILTPTHAIRNLIREGKTHLIYSQMQVGQEKTQMITLNQSLANLVSKKIISKEEAINFCSDEEELKRLIR
jgi:twitching motility protein PilT